MEQYISKSALLAEIERLKDKLKASDSAAYAEAYIIGAEHTINTISDVIDTLEVKKIGVDIGSTDGDIGVKTIWDGDKIISNKVQKGE